MMRTAPLQAQRHDRLIRVQAELERSGWAALMCAHPLNVLMLSGYWPVIGTALAIFTVEPRLVLLVPEDEQTLAAAGWADDIHTFRPASLESQQNAASALSDTLHEILPSLDLGSQRIGYEAGPCHVPVPYASLYVQGGILPTLCRHAVPTAELVAADDMLQSLRMRLTPWELDRLRLACAIAGTAYEQGAAQLVPGLSEYEAAQLFYRALLAEGERQGEARADGFFYCMSGPNAAEAYAAYQRTRARRLQHGDLVLVHCNSYVDGYWTDITRTYFLGEPDDKVQDMFVCIVEAREAALSAIGPGIPAADVDRAAREFMTKYGYGKAFRHATGHGVGFTAIDHNERPHIAPPSKDVLESGMVFNIEPGIYLEGYGGIRDCNMVAVTDDGCELLSPFQNNMQEWSRPS